MEIVFFLIFFFLKQYCILFYFFFIHRRHILFSDGDPWRHKTISIEAVAVLPTTDFLHRGKELLSVAVKMFNSGIEQSVLYSGDILIQSLTAFVCKP